MFAQTNEKGQVTVKSSVLKQMEELKEEVGLTCCICREGYRYQPAKVSTYLKRVSFMDMIDLNPGEKPEGVDELNGYTTWNFQDPCSITQTQSCIFTERVKGEILHFMDEII